MNSPLKRLFGWCLQGLLLLLLAHPELRAEPTVPPENRDSSLALREVERLMARGWWREARERLQQLEAGQVPTVSLLVMRADVCFQLWDLRCTQDALARAMSLAAPDEATRLQDMHHFIQQQVGRVLVTLEKPTRINLYPQFVPLQQSHQTLVAQSQRGLQQLAQNPTLPDSMRWLEPNTEEPLPTSEHLPSARPLLLELWLPLGEYRLDEQAVLVEEGQTTTLTLSSAGAKSTDTLRWGLEVRSELLTRLSRAIDQPDIPFELGLEPLLIPGVWWMRRQGAWQTELSLGLLLKPVSLEYSELIGGGLVQPGPQLQLRLLPVSQGIGRGLGNAELRLRPALELGGYWLPGQVQNCNAIQGSNSSMGLCYFGAAALTARVAGVLELKQPGWQLQLRTQLGCAYWLPFMQSQQADVEIELVEFLPFQPVLGIELGLSRAF